MGHDQDHAIATYNTLVGQRCRLGVRTKAELTECNGFVVVLIDPCRDERAIYGRGLERFDEIGIGKQPDIVDEEGSASLRPIVYSFPLYS